MGSAAGPDGFAAETVLCGQPGSGRQRLTGKFCCDADTADNEDPLRLRITANSISLRVPSFRIRVHMRLVTGRVSGAWNCGMLLSEILAMLRRLDRAMPHGISLDGVKKVPPRVMSPDLCADESAFG